MMYKLGLHFLLLLRHLHKTLAAPMPDALGRTLLLKPTNSASNGSHMINLGLLNLLDLAETIPYPIPDSTIILMMNPRPHKAIPPYDLSICLHSTSTRALDHIRQHGDGPLVDSDDPFASGPFPDANCKFAVRSWRVLTPEGRVSYLTYGIVHTVLKGLLEYMLFPDPHCYFISFTVKDAQRGTVGAGSVGTAQD